MLFVVAFLAQGVAVYSQCRPITADEVALLPELQGYVYLRDFSAMLDTVNHHQTTLIFNKEKSYRVLFDFQNSGDAKITCLLLDGSKNILQSIERNTQETMYIDYLPSKNGLYYVRIEKDMNSKSPSVCVMGFMAVGK